ncbi:MAG TPA: DUF2637 domain-containing protein [Anaerolineae bacterium]|jgi:hypothetical protein
MTHKLISTIAAALVSLLALLAFVLSYSSLQHMAAVHGVGPWLSYLWPLLLDFAMIVFSLAILRANLRQESARYPWTLAIAFAGLATAGNVLDIEAMAAALGIPPIIIAAAVKALAPVALVLAFELLMSMLKAEIKRADVTASINDLADQRDTLTGTIADLETEAGTLAGKVGALRAELGALRKEKKQTYTGASDETKAEAAEIVRNVPHISGAELGRRLGKSERLGRRLKKELEPVVNHNGANHAD